MKYFKSDSGSVETIPGAITAGGRVTAVGLTNSSTLIESSVSSPAALSAGETTLWSPTAARTIRASASGVAFVCSMAAGTAYERRTIENVGAYAVTFGHEETSGSAANRFTCPAGMPYILWPGQSVVVWYNGSTSRWVVEGLYVKSEWPTPIIPGVFQAQTGYAATFLLGPENDYDTLGLRDTVGNVHVPAVNTPQLPYWNGDHRGVYCDATTDGFGGTNIFDTAANDFIFGTWVQVAATNTDDRGIMGRLSTVTLFWNHAFVNESDDGTRPNRISINIIDGTDSVSLHLDKVVTDGVKRLLLWQLDRNANIARARLCGVGEVAVTSGDQDATAIGTLSGGTGPAFWYGAATGLYFATGIWLSGGFGIVGTAARGANALLNLSHRLGAE